MKVELKHITHDAEKIIVECARVSTSMASDKNDAKLLQYLIKHQHWSPFEMASACLYIECDRATARQILRHRSFSFQEFSQRYAEPSFINGYLPVRVDGITNRQSSVIPEKSKERDDIEYWWADIQQRAKELYTDARQLGIAKEVARAVLPEGLTMSRMFMHGTIRSWIHYIGLRTKPDTQYEHRLIASAALQSLIPHLPNVFTSAMDD